MNRNIKTLFLLLCMTALVGCNSVDGYSSISETKAKAMATKILEKQENTETPAVWVSTYQLYFSTRTADDPSKEPTLSGDYDCVLDTDELIISFYNKSSSMGNYYYYDEDLGFMSYNYVTKETRVYQTNQYLIEHDVSPKAYAIQMYADFLGFECFLNFALSEFVAKGIQGMVEAFELDLEKYDINNREYSKNSDDNLRIEIDMKTKSDKKEGIQNFILTWDDVYLREFEAFTFEGIYDESGTLQHIDELTLEVATEYNVEYTLPDIPGFDA